MNKNIRIAVAAVLMSLAGNVAAADFSELGGMTAARLSAVVATEGIPVPVASKIRGQAGKAATLGKLAGDNGISGTPYQMLAELFEKGVVAAESDIVGSYSGRTLLAGAEKFTGAFLTANIVGISSADGGPLFEGTKAIYTGSYGNAKTPADRFDNVDVNTFFFHDLREFLDTDRGNGTMRSSDGMTAVKFWETGTQFGKRTYRQFGGYILERMETRQDDGSYKETGYSYYFKKLSDHGLFEKK